MHAFNRNTCLASQLVGPRGMGLQHPHLSWAIRSGTTFLPKVTSISPPICNFCISSLSTDFLTGLSQYSELRLGSCAMSEVSLGYSQTGANLWVEERLAAAITESPGDGNSPVNLLVDFLFSVQLLLWYLHLILVFAGNADLNPLLYVQSNLLIVCLCKINILMYLFRIMNTNCYPKKWVDV